MLLFAAPRVTPDVMLEFVNLVQRAGPAGLSKDATADFLKPRGTRMATKSAFDPERLREVAERLGLVVTKNDGCRLSWRQTATVGEPGLADLVHAALLEAPSKGNGALLDAYSVVVLESNTHGVRWVQETKDLPGALNASMPHRPMNKDRVRAWKRWLRLLGLGVFVTGGRDPQFVPVPVRRVRRVINALEPGQRGGAEFLKELVAALPYMAPGPRLREVAGERFVPPDPGAAPRLLAEALRLLEREGRLEFDTGGDASAATSITLPNTTLQRGDIVIGVDVKEAVQ